MKRDSSLIAVLKNNWAMLAAIVGLLAAGFGIGVQVEDTDNDGQPDRVVITKIKPLTPPATPVDGPDADREQDDALPLDAEAQEVLVKASKEPENFDLTGNLRGEDNTPIGPTGPLASQEWPGCRTRFVRSFSQRTSPVRAIALHYTVSGNVKGFGDMNGLTAYSNNPANQASWHFLIDREGHCYLSVPTRNKAWTISALNSQTINIEVVGRGSEKKYAGTAGTRKLRRVVRRAARIYGIPLRVGSVSNCQVTRKGIITHWQGGSCAGSHSDVRPYSLRRIVRRIRAS